MALQPFRPEIGIATNPVTESTMSFAGRIVESPTADGHRVDRERARRRFRFRRTVIHGLIGFGSGYLLLHPITMFVFDWMGVYPKGDPFLLCLDWLSRSFAIDMMPMGLVFGALAMLIGSVHGFYRSLVQFQRDELAHQLDLNERHRKQLERQYSALRQFERSKQRTTRFLVHDLKNHVGCVLGYAHQLLSRADKLGWERADVQALRTIQRQATRMAGALKDVLELARLEDQPRLRFESIPAQNLLRRSVEEAALGPGEGPVLIDREVPDDLEIACDAPLVERVMANLVLNAFKHNGPDIQVSVGVSRLDQEAEFFCRDTGEGIPDTVRGRLFEDFASGDRLDDRVPSFGLGLSFCKAAIEAHGGRIWFASTEGEGTTVFFSLPIPGEQGDST